MKRLKPSEVCDMIEDESGEYVRFDDLPNHFAGLVLWLASREADIALDMEDFGDLRATFIALVGREPECVRRPHLEDQDS